MRCSITTTLPSAWTPLKFTLTFAANSFQISVPSRRAICSGQTICDGPFKATAVTIALLAACEPLGVFGEYRRNLPWIAGSECVPRGHQMVNSYRVHGNEQFLSRRTTAAHRARAPAAIACDAVRRRSRSARHWRQSRGGTGTTMAIGLAPFASPTARTALGRSIWPARAL